MAFPLIWDDWNRAHIAKHSVTEAEVIEALSDQKAVSQKSYQGRIIVIGKITTGKTLSVVLHQLDNGFYVVTARISSRKERRIYDEKNENNS